MSIRGLIAIYAVFVLLFPLSLAVAAVPTDESASGKITTPILRVLTEQQAAWNQGDIPTFMSGYWNSPDLTFSGSSGISRGWQAVSDRYKQHYPDKAAMGHLEFSGLEVRRLGDRSALVLGHWQLKRASGDIAGVFSLVFQHFPEGWKIVHDHTSLVEPSHP
jgi:ketosteroid isomerase-like protein